MKTVSFAAKEHKARKKCESISCSLLHLFDEFLERQTLFKPDLSADSELYPALHNMNFDITAPARTQLLLEVLEDFRIGHFRLHERADAENESGFVTRDFFVHFAICD